MESLRLIIIDMFNIFMGLNPFIIILISMATVFLSRLGIVLDLYKSLNIAIKSLDKLKFPESVKLANKRYLKTITRKKVFKMVLYDGLFFGFLTMFVRFLIKIMFM